MPNFATKSLCPYCSFSRFWKLRRNKLKCKRCRREWSAARYPVDGIRSSSSEWRGCLRIFLRERTIRRIVDETGIPHSRAEHMAMHLRRIMEADLPVILPDPVEMDETYIGGQRKNKRLHIRRIQGKRGHGTDKLPIVGLFSRYSGQVYAVVLPSKLDVGTIFEIIERLVPRGARIYTDGFKMYRGLPQRGYAHAYVDHDGGEMVRDDVTHQQH